MPRILDKIIINGESSAGEWGRIESEYKNLTMLAEEIKDLGLLNQTDSFTNEMEKLCDEKLKADQKYVEGLRALGTALRKFVDLHS